MKDKVIAGILILLLLAVVLVMFILPSTTPETPFWDSTPHSSMHIIMGKDPRYNPVRVHYWTPLQTFAVDTTYDLESISVRAELCNCIKEDLESYPSFPRTTLRASVYDWNPEDGRNIRPPQEKLMGVYEFSVKGEFGPKYIKLKSDSEVDVAPGTTYSIAFELVGDGTDVYDVCVYRSLEDTTWGRGYVWDMRGRSTRNWIIMLSGEGQDLAMRLYGREVLN